MRTLLNALVAGMLFELLGGFMYTWSLFSPYLKSALSPTSAQTRLNVVSLVWNLVSFQPFGGAVYDRVGAFPMTIFGCTCGAISFIVYWCAVNFKGTLGEENSFLVMLIGAVFFGLSISCVNNVAIPVNVLNMPISCRGQLVGLLKGFYGLSASLLSWIYIGWMGSNAEYLLFCCSGLNALGLVFLPCNLKRTTAFCSLLPNSEASRVIQKRVRFVLGYVVCLAILLSGLGLFFGLSGDVDNQMASIVAAGIVVVFGLLFLFVRCSPIKSTSADVSIEDIDAYVRLEREAPNTLASSGQVAVNSIPEDKDMASMEPPSLSVKEAFSEPQIWMLCTCMFVAMGSGMTTLTNLAQIIESKQPEGTPVLDLISVGVNLASGFNALGRLVCGFVSEFGPLVRLGLTRPILLICANSLIALSCLFIALLDNSKDAYFNLCVCILTFSYGSFWACSPAIIRDLVGSYRFASIYSACVVSNALGVVVFNTVLASQVYDQHSGSDGKCYGQECYKTTYLVLACCGVPAIISACGLHWKTKHVYSVQRLLLSAR